MKMKKSIPKIITVTLNPSLDRTLTVHHLAADYYNYTTDQTRLDSAGNGVNISRALHLLGGDTEAIVLLGDDATGKAYHALISEEHFETYVIRREGKTRSDNIIVDTGTDTETHLVEEGVATTNEPIEMVQATINEIMNDGDFVVLAGTLPTHMPSDTFKILGENVKANGGHVVLFTSGEALTQCLLAKPDMVVLRQVDVETQFNIPIRVADDVLYGIQKIRQNGVGKVLVIEVGEDEDALLVTADGHWSESIAKVVKGTSSGIVDSLIAGFLYKSINDSSLADSLQYGSVSTLYTATRFGNEFGTQLEIDTLLTAQSEEALQLHMS